LTPKADVCGAKGDVRYGPIADIAPEASELIFGHCRPFRRWSKTAAIYFGAFGCQSSTQR